MKTLLPSLAAAGLLLGSASLSSAAVIFLETFGTVSGNTSFAAHTTANGFDNNDLTFTGTGDVRISTPSSGYEDASGAANVFLNVDRAFTISGIATVGDADEGYKLTFGAHKNTNASDMSELQVDYSTDGENWTLLTVPLQPTGSGTAIWRLIEVDAPDIPFTNSLSIRFTNTQPTGNPQFRIDDVSLIVIPEPSTALLGGLGLLGLLRRRR